MSFLDPIILLDTHVLVHSLNENGKLSKDQDRLIRRSQARAEPCGLSGMSLLEIAMLVKDGKIKGNLTKMFEDIDTSTVFKILPITTAIAAEAAGLLSLRDPADRVIVATARVHRLTLLTSDQRIINSDLVDTVG